MLRDRDRYDTPMFSFDLWVTAGVERAALRAGQMAARPQTVQAVLAAGQNELSREFDFMERFICGDPSAELVYGTFLEQLEQPAVCDALLSTCDTLSLEERSLLLDHYLVVAHRLARGFDDRSERYRAG